MPVSLPTKSLTKTPSAQRIADSMGIWALTLGVAATAIAGLIYFTGGEPAAASFVLVAAATIVGIALREAARIPDR